MYKGRYFFINGLSIDDVTHNGLSYMLTKRF